MGLVTIRPHFKVGKNLDVRMTVCSRHSSQESAGGQAIPGPGTLTCPWDELWGTPPLTCSLSFHRGSEEELKSRLRVVKVCTHKHQDPQTKQNTELCVSLNVFFRVVVEKTDSGAK